MYVLLTHINLKKHYFISYLHNLAQEIRRHFNFIWLMYNCQNHNHILGKMQKLWVAIMLKNMYIFQRMIHRNLPIPDVKGTCTGVPSNFMCLMNA